MPNAATGARKAVARIASLALGAGLILVGCADANLTGLGGTALSETQRAMPAAATGNPPPPPPTKAEGNKPPVSWALYTPFFDQGDHLNRLIGNGELDDATTFYVEQKAFFDRSPEVHGKSLKRLADSLNEGEEPPLKSALEQIEAIGWPAPVAAWPEVGRRLAAARAAIGAYPRHEMLNDPRYRSPLAGRLKVALDEMTAKVVAEAPAEFARFDHFGDASFFATYPGVLSPRSFLEAHFAVVRAQLAPADTDRIRRFASHYPAASLGPALWQKLGEMYVAAYLRDPTRVSSNELASVLGAVRAAKDAGFDPHGLPDLKIAFVEVTSRTLLKEGQIEFPGEVDIDLPVTVAKAAVDDALTAPASQSANYVIVFDTALAKARRKVSQLRKMPSKVLVGYQKEPNPEYEIARMKVVQAQNELMMVQLRYSNRGGLLGAIEEAYATAAARNVVELATRALQGTPQFTEKPIYQPYDYEKATVKAQKNMTVHYYVLDKRKGTYFKSTFDVEERRDFAVAYRVQENDPDKSSHLDNANTEDEVAAFEDAPSTIRLSQLVDHYLANAGQSKPLPSLAALRAEMLADKNTALAKFEANRFDARPLNDPRFDSVVVIYTAESLGSGFFVKPDVVLTNWHVVQNQQYVELRMYDGQETFGKVLAKDVRLDVALVKVQSRGKPVRFYSRKTVDLGATLEAIGHPKRFEFAITRGIVSAIRRYPSINLPGGTGGGDVLYIQTDTPINPGNSGGPLYLGDYVVGMNTWGVFKHVSEGVNFAVHYSELLEFIKEALPGFQADPGSS